MGLKDLVRAFSCHTVLPVKVKDVVATIVEMGIQDKITYIGVDFDTGALRGKFLRLSTERDVPYGNPVHCAEIYYAKNQEIDWQRLVVCKELVHLFDGDEVATSTQAELDHLMEMMSLSPELQFQKNDGFKVLADKIAVLYAVCILFPKDARDEFLDAYKQGLITAEDIARMAEIPEKYIRLAMLDGWDAIYKTLSL